jgi:2,4-dienoyl-CoA reductase-like NADH-dependent reductase (Old Yellow Enzyme family)
MSSLFNPIQVGSLMLRNRVGMSALTRNRAPNAIPSDVMAEYYAQRAAGGAGLIVSEGILVSRQGFVNHLRLGKVNAHICSLARSGVMRLVYGIKNKFWHGRR